MRLIDADKLTTDLIENKSFYPAIVKRAIEEAPTVQAIGEWISVEERLPKVDELVLVSTFGGFLTTDFVKPNGKWCGHWQQNVSYWMPLPQPPQMKGE